LSGSLEVAKLASTFRIFALSAALVTALMPNLTVPTA